jgi:hypothetical protein
MAPSTRRIPLPNSRGSLSRSRGISPDIFGPAPTLPEPPEPFLPLILKIDGRKSGASLELPYNNFDSELELPPSGSNENARLTIRLMVAFVWADSQNRVPGVIERVGDEYRAVDADTPRKFFPCMDWDFSSKLYFRQYFAINGKQFWDRKFVLKTPKNYDRLDSLSHDLRWVIRPNIECRFDIWETDEDHASTVINVVRLGRAKQRSDDPPPNTFRSSSSRYSDIDAHTQVLYHELGHAIGQSHIKGMETITSNGSRGDSSCVTAGGGDINAPKCYVASDGDRSNVMASGDKLSVLNALSWQKRITAHCRWTDWTDWPALLGTALPPRRTSALAAQASLPEF